MILVFNNPGIPLLPDMIEKMCEFSTGIVFF